MKREIRYSPELELRQEADGKVKIRGYAAVFNQLSQNLGGFREKIAPGAFAKTLGADVRALIDHDPARIIGRSKSGTLTMTEDEHGLHVEISPPDTTAGRDVVESIRRGDLDQMSFGFQTVTDSWQKENGEQIRELREVNLFDVSVVAFPAYSQTSVAVRSLFPEGMPESLEEHIKPEGEVAAPPKEPEPEPVHIVPDENANKVIELTAQLKAAHTKARGFEQELLETRTACVNHKNADAVWMKRIAAELEQAAKLYRSAVDELARRVRLSTID